MSRSDAEGGRPVVSDGGEAPAPRYATAGVELRRAPKAEPRVLRGEVVPARAGDDMPATLEGLTRAAKAASRGLWERAESGEELTKAERAELRAWMDPITKLSREVRAWRQVQESELGGLDDAELARLLPEAAAALGIEVPEEDDDGE